MTALRLLLVDAGATWRGGQRQTALLAESLMARGVAVTIASPLIAVAGANTEKWTAGSDLSLRAAWQMARIARRARADVVHAMDGRSHAIARLATLFGLRAPLVVTRNLTRTPVSRLKYRGVSRYIAISTAVRNALAGVVDADRITVIPCAVRASSPQPSRKVNERPIVVTVAALTHEKGVDRVIRLASAARTAGLDARWLVVGDGPERAALERLNRELAAGVEFIGWRDDVGAILHGATLVVHLPRAEALSLAMLEAIAHGVPVVASRVGGLTDLITPDIGSLVQADDALGALTHWLTNEAARAVAASRGPQIAARYSPETQADDMLAVYRDVIRTGAEQPVRPSARPSVRLSA